MNQQNSQPDFNLLNLKRQEAGDFSLRLPKEPSEFYVAFQHPGWLRFYETGPFTNDDIVNATLTLDVPKPASIEVRFDAGDIEEESLPFAEVYCDVMWQNPDAGNSMYSVNYKDRTLKDGVFRITGLGPGTYRLRLTTKPKETVKQIDETEINPGRFFEQRKVEALAGQTAKEVISFVPFDANANTGSGNARISVMLPNGKPAAGKPLKIRWYDGHYGSLVIFHQPVSDDGIVHLNGISQKVYDTPFGPYSVSVGDETLGFFRLKKTKDIQDFEFRIAPGVGDAAPDFVLLNIQTKEKCRLSDFRGKIVLVEFWATWCGPCQPAMSKLTELFAVNETEWKDEVVIIPLSTDDSIDRAAKHIASRGWGTMPQYWAEREGDEYFTAAERAYVVHGIPHAILIDSSGKIAWRGHPLLASDGKDIAARIGSLQTP